MPIQDPNLSPPCDDPRALKECDLVMKGGITSGIVYPSAVLELHKRYRFRGIGGTSAGAMAAAATAAAEYGRQMALLKKGDPEASFDELRRVQVKLCEPGFLRGLFQPEPSTQVLMEVASAAFKSAGKKPKPEEGDPASQPDSQVEKWARVAGKTASVYGKFLCWTPGFTLGGAAFGFVLAILLSRLNGTSPHGAGWISPAFGAALGGFLGGVAGTFRALTVDVRDNRFGICSGRPPGTDPSTIYDPNEDDEALWTNRLQALGVLEDSPEARAGFRLEVAQAVVRNAEHQAHTPVLTDWFCDRIDRIAGLSPEDGPLTFGMLKQPEVAVDLRMVTTNVSQNQPYELPFQKNFLLFKTDEMLQVFPARIVRHLLRTSFTHREVVPPPGYHYLPDKADLPVVVAMRMSLSFPVLLSAVKLYTLKQEAREEARHRRPTVEDLLPNWFSDGGISSNFPIHFFDSWLPSRPTFGINLTTVPEREKTPDLAHVGGSGQFVDPAQTSVSEDPVLTPANEYPTVEVHRVQELVSFLGAAFSTAQNFRDNMQSALPSYRERIVHVRLAKDEGGLNLDMPTSVLDRIVEKGRESGEKLIESYDKGDGFAHHRWVRYLVLMNLLEKELSTLQRRLTDEQVGFKSTIGAQLAARIAAETDPGVKRFPYNRNPPWCDKAERLSDELAEFLAGWLPEMRQAIAAREAAQEPDGEGDSEQRAGRKSGPRPHFADDAPRDEPVLRVVPRI